MTINDWWRDRPEERYWMIAPSGGRVGDALRLASPITLTGLRRIGGDIVAIRDAVESSTDGPVYFPFIGSAEKLVPAPAYLSKVPRDLVALLSSRFGFEFAL